MTVSYKNGKDVLPPRLLEELQKYTPGELIYVPKPSECRAGWGEVSGTRKMLLERNEEIRRSYAEGRSVDELESIYHLSGDSIRRIIFRTKAAESRP
ncbi:CD3324 family protein [Cohnella caldifontis]|uniref:CD3324 family protein n=1 Tax=Cohnella caldifontis TaxID=3027471 RepID=UPI0023EDA614|nr:CD3324 family protein [Cohnella sp. YIM B05605]